MPEQMIECPNCGNKFEVANVLTESIRSQLRGELEAGLIKKEEEATKRLKKAEQIEAKLVEREEYDSRDWALDGIDPDGIAAILSFGALSPDYSVTVVRAQASYRF